MERRNSPNTKNLSFIQAKDSFHMDREAILGIKDDSVDYRISFLQDRDNEYEEKKNP